MDGNLQFVGISLELISTISKLASLFKMEGFKCLSAKINICTKSPQILKCKVINWVELHVDKWRTSYAILELYIEGYEPYLWKYRYKDIYYRYLYNLNINYVSIDTKIYTIDIIQS